MRGAVPPLPNTRVAYLSTVKTLPLPKCLNKFHRIAVLGDRTKTHALMGFRFFPLYSSRAAWQTTGRSHGNQSNVSFCNVQLLGWRLVVASCYSYKTVNTVPTLTVITLYLCRCSHCLSPWQRRPLVHRGTSCSDSKMTLIFLLYMTKKGGRDLTTRV